MIINSKDAEARLNSPLNLINRLRGTPRQSSMNIFMGGKSNGNGNNGGNNGNTEKEKQETITENKESIEPAKRTFNPFQKTPETALVPTPPSTAPTLDKILDNAEVNVKLGLAHDKAVNLLYDSLNTLTNKLERVDPAKLPAVISAAAKTVESIRKERIEANKNSKDREVHYHFYTPTQKKISDYEVIDVKGIPVEENHV